MHKFTFISETNSNKTSLEYNPVYGTPSLPDIVDQFKKFLLGCGYELNDDIQVVINNTSHNTYQAPKDFDNFTISSIDLSAIQPINLSGTMADSQTYKF